MLVVYSSGLMSSETALAGVHKRSICETLTKEFGPDSIAGSMIEQEAVIARLLDAVRPSHILEIGTRHGVSASLFAQHARQVTTIDVEICSPQYRKWASRILSFFDLTDRVRVYYAKGKNQSECNADKFEFIGLLDFDFCFVDGVHSGPAVAMDFEAVKRCGCVLFHDYKPVGGVYSECSNNRFPDVVEVIDRLRPRPFVFGRHDSLFALWIEDSMRVKNPSLCRFLETEARRISFVDTLKNKYFFCLTKARLGTRLAST